MLVRGIGPTLASFGISNRLLKPVLKLFDGSGKNVATRRSQDLIVSGAIDSTIRNAGRQVDAFDLPVWSNGTGDTALLIDLAPGAYTVSLTPDTDSPPNSTVGVVLLEIYDLTPSNGRLVNLSTRAIIGRGEEQLFVGFAIRGSTGSHGRMLLRGIGPGLVNFGLPSTVADPNLSVFDNRGRALAGSDNWSQEGGNDQVTALTRVAGAFPLSFGSKDSALVTRLSPGLYTAIMQPDSASVGTTGLLEIYEAP
ncbi:MAG: hypothetical protein NTV51_00005 [Verrucomicrobia bacterium]|nr:hypothetical protein [Verrucomicrobiota bacterium]